MLQTANYLADVSSFFLNQQKTNFDVKQDFRIIIFARYF